jgi:hypothetical protein
MLCAQFFSKIGSKEILTVFVNSIEDSRYSSYSWVYDFEIYVPAASSNENSDFETRFERSACKFRIVSHGGARLLSGSEEERVWLVADNTGLWCVDTNDGSNFFGTPVQSTPYYDTFIYFTVQSQNDLNLNKPVVRNLNETI